MGKFITILKRATAIILASVMIGIMIISSFNRFLNQYSNNTIVGNINLSGELKSTARIEVLDNVTTYLDDFRIIFEFNNRVYEVPSDIVTHDLNDTLSMISNGKQSYISYVINSDLLFSDIGKQIPTEFLDVLSVDEILQEVNKSLFNNEPILYIHLTDYIEELDKLTKSINTYVYTVLINTDLIKNIEDTEFIIEPNSRFSFLTASNQLFLTNDELSILATGVTAVVIDTNFVSFIKNNHTNTTNDTQNNYDYYDTYINRQQGKDMGFYNPFDFPYKVTVTKTEQSVVFTLVGIEFDDEYIHKVTETPVEYLTIVAAGETTVGVDGVLYEVKRYIVRDGIEILDQILYTNFYGPINEVIN